MNLAEDSNILKPIENFEQELESNKMDEEEPDENWKNVYNNNVESINYSNTGEQMNEEEGNDKMQAHIDSLLNIKENGHELINNKLSPIKKDTQIKIDNANNVNNVNKINDTTIRNNTLPQKKELTDQQKDFLRRKKIKKERYLMNVVQNYIIKNDFRKLIELSLQFNYSDFNENDKNEKFLKVIKDRLGLEKYLCLLIKSMRDLQKTYFENKKIKKPLYTRPTYTHTQSQNISTSSKPNNLSNLANIANNTSILLDAINNANNANISPKSKIKDYDPLSLPKPNPKPSKPKKPEKEVELDLETIKNINGLTSLDLELNNINSGLDGNSKSKMRITYEDLNKEITDILNGTATKMTKKTENSNNQNNEDLNIITTSSKNNNDSLFEEKFEQLEKRDRLDKLDKISITEKSEKSENFDKFNKFEKLDKSDKFDRFSTFDKFEKYDRNDKNDFRNDLSNILNSEDGMDTEIGEFQSNNLNSFYSQLSNPSTNTNTNTNTNSSILNNHKSNHHSKHSSKNNNKDIQMQGSGPGLSVHLHKDSFKRIYKYYMHHYMTEGLAAFYCSDKKCTGTAKYTVESKKFEVASEHSIPYNEHSYISKMVPNDQRLFREFEKRNFSEAQLFKQTNGRSNINWYN